jgi:hypothetical protein
MRWSLRTLPPDHARIQFDEGFALLPDWEEIAAHVWEVMAQEIKQGVHPDFDIS